SLVELPSPYTGVVSEILAPEGTTVEVGVPIIVVDTDPAGEAPATPSVPAATVPGGADAPDAAAPAAPGSGSVLVGCGTVEPGTARRRRRAAEPAPAAPAATAPPAPAPAARPAPSAPPAPAPRAATPTSAPTAHVHLPVLAKPPVRKLAKDLGVDLA